MSASACRRHTLAALHQVRASMGVECVWGLVTLVLPRVQGWLCQGASHCASICPFLPDYNCLNATGNYSNVACCAFAAVLRPAQGPLEGKKVEKKRHPRTASDRARPTTRKLGRQVYNSTRSHCCRVTKSHTSNAHASPGPTDPLARTAMRAMYIQTPLPSPARLRLAARPCASPARGLLFCVLARLTLLRSSLRPISTAPREQRRNLCTLLCRALIATDLQSNHTLHHVPNRAQRTGMHAPEAPRHFY